jgi:fatty acid desaturase
MDTEAQLLDSINLRGWSFLTALIAPVGLRYHALHHYLPFIPYHSLGLVHRRLLADLPQNAPYRATVRDGLYTLRGLWRNAAAPPRETFSASPVAREF